MYSPEPEPPLTKDQQLRRAGIGFHERARLGRCAVVRCRRPGRRRPPLGRGAKRRRKAGLFRGRAKGGGRHVTFENHMHVAWATGRGQLNRA